MLGCLFLLCSVWCRRWTDAKFDFPFADAVIIAGQFCFSGEFLSGFDVPSSLVAAWAAENSPGDLVDDGLCKKHVDENDAVPLIAGFLYSCLVSGPSLSAEVKFFISGLARSSQKPGKEVPVQVAKFLMKSFFPQVSCAR